MILGASYSITRHPLSDCLVMGDAKSAHAVKVMLRDLCMVSCILRFTVIICFVRWFFGSVQMTHFPVILFTYLFWYSVLILAYSVRVTEWYMAISIILSAFISWDSSIKLSFSVSAGLPMSSDICIFFYWSIADLQCFIKFSIQQSGSVIHIHSLFHILFLYDWSKDIEYSSLCYTVGH